MLGPYNFSRTLFLYDEGVLLTGAKRLIQGEMPYKDFWTIYAPLNYILLGGFFKTLGMSILTERIFNLTISLAGLLSVYILFRTKTNWIYAGIVCLLFVAFPSPIKITHLFILLALFANFSLINKSRSKLTPIICGIICGLGFLNRFDFGGLIGAISITSFILIYKPNYKILLKQILRFILGFSIIIIPVLAWIISNGAFKDMVDQTFLYPFLGNYSAMRSLPFPTINTEGGLYITLGTLAKYFFPFFVILFSFLSSLSLKKDKKSRLKIILFALFVIGTIPYLLSRSDSSHFNFTNILSLILFFYALFSIKKINLKYFLISLTLPLLLLFLPFVGQIQTTITFNHSPQKTYSFYSQPLKQTEENDALENVYEYIKKISSQTDPIYIGLYDHTKIYGNNAMLYFMLPNKIATKYNELHPGITTTIAVQKKIIEELNNVKHIVLWDHFSCEQNESCKSSEVKLLDEYIDNHYSTVKTFGKYKILRFNQV